MNKKLRVFMLSLAVVMFTAASAFAILVDDAEIVEGENNTSTFTPGYNYRATYTLQLAEFSGEEGETDTRTLGNVSWDFYPYNASDTWLKHRVVTGTNTSTLIVEGLIPDYNASANQHYFMIAAHVSADVENEDYDSEVAGSQEYITQDNAYYAGSETPEGQSENDERQWVLIEPEEQGEDAPATGLFTGDLVSIDTSAVSDMSVARKDYSITITFPRTTAVTITTEDIENEETGEVTGTRTVYTSADVTVNAQLEYTPVDPEAEEPEPVIATDNLNLPSWLAYEVVETQHEGAWTTDDNDNPIYEEDPESTFYVKTLRIFYSADAEPADGTPASVKILVTPSSTPSITDEREYEDESQSQTTQALSDKYPNNAVISWTLAYSAIAPISLDKSEATVTVDYGSSADLRVNYDTQSPSGDITFSPSLSDKVTLTATVTPANSTDPSGYITVNVVPVAKANAVYSTDMIVTDTNGQTATVRINVSVDVPVIVISSDRAAVDMSTAPYTYDWLDTHTQWYYARPVSIDLSPIPAGLNVTVVSTDESDTVKHGHIIFTYYPVIAGSWDGKIKVYDEYGGSADITMQLRTEVTSADMTTSVTVSGDTSTTPTIYPGQAATLVLNATNSYGPVTWTLDNGSALYALGITLSQVSSTDNSAVYTLTTPKGLAAGTYEAVVSAKDGIGRSAGAYTLTMTVKDWPIVLSGDLASLDIVYPASGEVSIAYYDAEMTSWVMSPDISADISLDMTVVPASTDSSYDVEGTINITVTPLTAAAATYTTTIYFYDSNDNYESRDLTVNVTLPELALSSDSVTLSANVNDTKSESVSYSGATIASYTLSGEMPSQLGFAVASTDSTVTFSIAPTAAGTYSGTVTLVDIYGTTAAVSLTLSATQPAPVTFTLTPSTATATVAVNGTQNVSFSVSGNSGDVTWRLGTVPSGISVSPSTTQTGTNVTYTVTGKTASSTPYSVEVTATDAAGRSAKATISITVTDNTGEITVTPSPSTLSITTGNSASVTFTASGNSGTVTWTLGTVPSGISVSPSTAQTGSSATYTVKGETAGTYTLSVTASDAAGASSSSSVSVTVTSSPTPPDADTTLTEETQTLVDGYKSTGALNSDGTIPDSAISYTSTSTTAHTLSKTGTNQVSKGSSINPVDLVLDFPVDIWKVYINNVLVAWAYSPSVTPSEADDFMTFYPADGTQQGVDIVAESDTKATITFDTTSMSTGSNTVTAAFVPDITAPTQEIGKTNIATINVTDTDSGETTDPTGVGSSSGGCSAGLGAFVSALAAAFFISKKRS